MSLTPEEFNKLALKEDVKKNLEKRFDEFEIKVDTKFDAVMETLDGIVKKLELKIN